MTAKATSKSSTYKQAVIDNWKVISVGNVNVKVQVPNEVELRKRVIESKSIAGRLRVAIARPGIKLNVKAATPIYSADHTDPNLIVRKVGNRITRGLFNKNGVFVKVK